MSRDFNIPRTSTETHAAWRGADGSSCFVEIRQTNSIRDVRDAFLGLAHLLQKKAPQSTALCVLVESRLSEERLQDELARFRDVIRPDIGPRIHFLVRTGNGEHPNTVSFKGSLKDVPGSFYTWLEALMEHERVHGRSAPRRRLPPRQIVMAALAQLRLRNHPPVTIRHLQEICTVSYPTVAAVLKDLSGKGWLEDSGERGVRLRPLTTGEWMTLARDHGRLRQTHLYTDATGHSSPERMVKQLARLQAAGKASQKVRIGGVIGASRHFPELDITAAPRLDLSIDTLPAQLAALLDAGLRRKTKPEQQVALALHVTNDSGEITGVEGAPPGPQASELECLSDLIEMDYVREATEIAHHMELMNQNGRNRP